MRKEKFKKQVAGIMTISCCFCMLAGATERTITANCTKASERERDYLVVLQDEGTANWLEEVAEMQDVNGQNQELLNDAEMLGIHVTETKAKALNDETGVISVEEDISVTGSDVRNDETIAIREVAESQWNIKAVHADDKRMARPKDKKIKVAVLDSGVAVTEDIHIEKRVNLVEEGECSYLCEDMTGHGTAVAGIIASKDNEIGTTGIDESLELYSVKVLDEENSAPLSRVSQVYNGVLTMILTLSI